MNADTPRHTPDTPSADAAPSWANDVARDRLLEARLTRLENYLGFQPLSVDDAEAILEGPRVAPRRSAAVPAAPPDGGIEREIGEFWLARIGVVALIIGLGFLVAYPFPALPAAVPSLIGFVAFGLLWWGSVRWRVAWPELAPLMFWGALFLGFFATVRLHYFSPSPLLASAPLTLGLVVLVLVGQYAVALRRGCQKTAALVTVLAFVTAIAADSLPGGLTLMTMVSALAVWLVRTRGWLWHWALAGALAFGAQLIYLVNNPLAGHAFRGISESQGSEWFLAAISLILASVEFLPGEDKRDVWVRIARPFLLSGAVLLLAFLNILQFHRAEPPWVELCVAALFLTVAMAAWWHHGSRYATAIFACSAYVTLSVFLVRQFPGPQAFGWLAWESLLVVATAVSFRSKIIVVANVVIFAIMYAVYLVLSRASGPVNLSFAAVALVTARLLNGQSERLELRTELMRNFYLGAATVAVPYGLYHTVAPGWISTSWLAAAGAYFGISVWLRNRKYRWMAMGTVLATIIYVFVVDLSRLAPAYRIISFLVLGVALLGISIFYARSRQTEAVK